MTGEQTGRVADDGQTGASGSGLSRVKPDENLGGRLIAWLKAPWWPPSFLRRAFNWRLPIIIGVVCSVVVAYLSGGANSVWVLLFSVNAVIYMGVPFLLALVIFWKSSSDRGRLIACDLVSCLLVLLFVVPGNIMGGIYVNRQIDRAKIAGSAIAALVEDYRDEWGRLPASLQEIERSQQLPESPFPVNYRVDPSAGLYELSIADPTCLFECHWVYHPAQRQWSLVGS